VLGLVLGVKRNRPAQARVVIHQGEPVPVPLETQRERAHEVTVDFVQDGCCSLVDWWVGLGLALDLDAGKARGGEGKRRWSVGSRQSNDGLMADEGLEGALPKMPKASV
jgi:hypothetical protein